MRLSNKVLLYHQLDAEMKIKVEKKYLDDPDKALIQIPISDTNKFVNVIEIWHDHRGNLVVIDDKDLKDIEWQNYYDSGDDGLFLPYIDRHDYHEFFEEN